MRITLKRHPAITGLFASKDGRIFQELTASPGHGGYHTVKVHGATIRRHVLVLEAFRGLAPAGHEARRLDGDPSNDRASNLRWATHRVVMGATIERGTSTRGTRNGSAKLTTAQARAILQRRRAGKSGRALAREFAISEQTVCDIFRRRIWPELGD